MSSKRYELPGRVKVDWLHDREEQDLACGALLSQLGEVQTGCPSGGVRASLKYEARKL